MAYAFLAFGLVAIAAGLFLAYLAIRSRDPDNLGKVAGKLTKRKGYKNAKMKYYTVRNLTEYTYTYTIGSKSYTLSGRVVAHPRKLQQNVSIVYLKGFPKIACIEEFTAIPVWLVAFSCFMLGMIMTVCGFLV